MAKLSKKDLVSYVKTETGLTQAQTDDVVRAAFKYIKERVAAGDEIAISDFGSFVPVHVDARKGFNPRTKEPIEIQATTKPKFRPGKSFRDAVAGA